EGRKDMRRLMRITAALGLAAALMAAPSAAQAADLGHLRALAGQYTNVLVADKALDAALHDVLGADYDSFMSVMQVVVPSRLIDGRFLVAEGCRAHDCGNHGGIIVIDLEDGEVMALRRGTYGLILGATPALEAVI